VLLAMFSEAVHVTGPWSALCQVCLYLFISITLSRQQTNWTITYLLFMPLNL